MKQIIQQEDELRISKKEYLHLCKLYYFVHEDLPTLSKIPVTSVFTTPEEEKIAASLVRKNLCMYYPIEGKDSGGHKTISNPIGLIQVTLKGWNVICKPPGLSLEEQNSILSTFNKSTKSENMATKKKAAKKSAPKKAAAKKGASVKNTKTGPTKKEVVAKYLKQGKKPAEIFEAMTNDGIETTLASVRCFIQAINKGA